MKTNRNLLIAALGAAALFTLGSEARAQRMAQQVIASPKFQQQLNESERVAPTTVLVTRTGDLVGGRQQLQITHHSPSHRVANSDGVAASPKHRQLLAEQATGTNASANSSAGYKATGADGITASPKHRQLLDENAVSFQIAPVK